MTRALGRELVATTRSREFALAAFNVSNLETAQAVLGAAEEANAPVIVQVSPGAIAYAGYASLTRLVFDLADRAATPVLVHLDHCRDPDVVRQALSDGYGSVMFDGSRLPLEENVAATASLAASAHERGAAMEGELGLIGGREDTRLADAVRDRTTPAEARGFVEATGVDLLAPAIGSLHRMPDDSVQLDLQYLRAVADAAGRPLVLHGGSGVDRTQLRAAVAAGVGKVNLSSRVGRALAGGIRAIWQETPDESDLRRYLGAGRDAVRAMAMEYLELTASAGRARPAAAAAFGWAREDDEPE